jgi:hypothetical protein
MLLQQVYVCLASVAPYQSDMILPQTETSLPVSHNRTEKGLPTQLSKEQRRSLWLAALPQDELERLAAGGGDWHSMWIFLLHVPIVYQYLSTDVPRSNICFACKQPGKFLNCASCPRSYHAECVELGQGIVSDDWACPACAILDTDDRLASKTTGQLTELSQSSYAHSSGETPSQSTILVSGPQLKEMGQSSPAKEEPIEGGYQAVHSAQRQSSSVGAAVSPPNVIPIMSNGDNTGSNKPRRVKLPDPSADASNTRFIHAHPTMAHEHSSASSKSGWS